MAFVVGLKYKAPDRILGILDEETLVVIEQNNKKGDVAMKFNVSFRWESVRA